MKRFLPLLPLGRVARLWRSTRRTVERVPDVVDAVLILPKLAVQLEHVRLQTATLIDMEAEIARVRGDTATLRSIDETLQRVAVQLGRIDANTAHVEELAQVMVPLQGAAVRVGRVADRWPARRPRP